jgi:hypothetical protein
MKRIPRFFALLIAIPAALITVLLHSTHAMGGTGRGYDLAGSAPPRTKPTTTTSQPATTATSQPTTSPTTRSQ